jgi:hypothetical protein
MVLFIIASLVPDSKARWIKVVKRTPLISPEVSGEKRPPSGNI